MALVDDPLVLVDDGGVLVDSDVSALDGAYDVTTERIYSRLPEIYRLLDEQNDFTMKKFISGIGSQMNEIDELVARFQFVPIAQREEFIDGLDEYTTYQRSPSLEDETLGYAPMHHTSDLVDPRTANAEWIDWIAQLAGVNVDTIYTTDEKRQAIALAYTGYKAGSRESMRSAVLNVLTDTKYLRVITHARGAIDGVSWEPGTQWEIVLITKADESPAEGVIVSEIIRKGAKPAGVVLYHLTYSLSWDVLETTFTSWDSIEALGSWDALETSGSEYTP